MSTKLEDLYTSSHLYGSNAPFIEDFYEDWLEDESSVPAHWANTFSKMLNGGGPETGHLDIQEKFRVLGRLSAAQFADADSTAQLADHKQARVLRLITIYRLRGHEKASLNPLGDAHHEPLIDLDLAYEGTINF